MNKKLTKLLSIFLIAGLIGTGAATGLTACGGKNDDETNTEQPNPNPDPNPNPNPNPDPNPNPNPNPDPNPNPNPDPNPNPNPNPNPDPDPNPNPDPDPEPNPDDESNRAIVPVYTGPAAGPEAGTKDFEIKVLGTDIAAGNLSEAWTNGTITISKGTEIRNRVPNAGENPNNYSRSIKNGTITIVAPEDGTVTFDYSSGSSGGGAKYTIKEGATALEGKNEVLITTGDKVLATETFAVEKGKTYTILKANGTVDIYMIKLNFSSTATPLETLEVVNVPQTEYLLTQKVDLTNVSLIAKDATGVPHEVSLANCQFDTSAYNPNEAGEYEIGVTYNLAQNLDSQNTALTATIKVSVCTINDISVSLIGLASSKPVSVKQGFVTGETFNTNNITVSGKVTKGSTTVSQKLKSSWYTVTTHKLSEPGKQTVTVSIDPQYTEGHKNLSFSYDIMVKEKLNVEDNKVTVTVGETSDFQNLTQAVQYLKACSYDDSVEKIIRLAPDTYEEKVTIDVNNVTLVGTGTKADDTVVTYSLVEGDVDPLSNAVWALNCASVHVTGKNFKAYNLAIRNDFDYIANNKKYSGSQAAQGVALTIDNSDTATIANCHLFGNQDTLYMKTGKCYYYKTQIDGNIDFIFGGEASRAFFDNCKIVAIDRQGGEQTGYVTAPQHKPESKPDQGYVFYKCELTDDGNVQAGSMSLGRPWGKAATVAYIECSFSAAYSQQPSDSAGKIHRWNDWDTNTTAANADYCEYGSTDADGSPIMQTAVKGGKVLTAEQAAAYTKKNTFGSSYNADQALISLYQSVEDGFLNSILIKDASGQTTLTGIKVVDGQTYSAAELTVLIDAALSNASATAIYTDTEGTAYVPQPLAGGATLYISTGAVVEKQWQVVSESVCDSKKITSSGSTLNYDEDYYDVKGDFNDAAHAGHPRFFYGNEVSFYVSGGNAYIDMYALYSGGGKYVFTASADGVTGIVGQKLTTSDNHIKVKVIDLLKDNDGTPVDCSSASKIKITITVEETTGDAYIHGLTVSYPTFVNITLNMNGGDQSNATITDAIVGSKVEAPANPTKDGYTFAGWFTAAEGGDEFKFATDNVSASITTLYAHWTEGVVEKKIDKTTTITFGSGESCNYKTYKNDEILSFTGIQLPEHGTSDVHLDDHAVITIKVDEGVTADDISIEWYDTTGQYGSDDNADISVADGVATITIDCGDGTSVTTGLTGQLYIRSITIAVKKVITEDTKIQFGDSYTTADNYYTVYTGNGLLSVTSGSLKESGNNDAQQANGSCTLVVNVKSGAVVKVKDYANDASYFTVKVGETDITTAALGSDGYTATEDSAITIIMTNGSYIYWIDVTYPNA